MDGTLIDTMPTHIQAWAETAKAFNFPFSEEWLYSLGGMPSFKIAQEVNKKHHLQLNPIEVSDFKMAAFKRKACSGEVIACTYQVLLEHYGQKKLAIGTGSQRDGAMALLEKSNILPKLDAVVTATDVQRHKPEPDTFLMAAEKLNLKPQDCVVFEDTELGKQAAHAAGMDCFMIKNDRFSFHPVSG